jgi:hypothetical protein
MLRLVHPYPEGQAKRVRKPRKRFYLIPTPENRNGSALRFATRREPMAGSMCWRQSLARIPDGFPYRASIRSRSPYSSCVPRESRLSNCCPANPMSLGRAPFAADRWRDDDVYPAAPIATQWFYLNAAVEPVRLASTIVPRMSPAGMLLRLRKHAAIDGRRLLVSSGVACTMRSPAWLTRYFVGHRRSL